MAATAGKVCGFALMHYYPKVRLAFMAYLVVEKGVSASSTTVSHSLLAHVSSLLSTDEQLKNCSGVVFEVDDPILAATDDERRERLARIRLFCMLAEANGIALRGLDFDYHQPPLQISEDAQDLPMMLMHGSLAQRKRNWVSKEEVTGLLKFIYEQLYPEGFSDISEENIEYRERLKSLCRARVKNLPTRTQMLNFRQIQSRRRR